MISPALYEIDARLWLAELGERLGRTVTLDDIPDGELDRLASFGFDWLWLLGAWCTGPAGQAVSRSRGDWRRDFDALLPGLRENDIAGSPFAIAEYRVRTDLGGDAALARLRRRLARRGLRLMLDFVPNHTALDHPWAYQHPEYYVHGDERDLEREPANYCRTMTRDGPRILAHGRDPCFPGWPDTLQLDYRSPALRDAMRRELGHVAAMCDGVRCDMAMLLLPDVIERTWGARAAADDGGTPAGESFWARAIDDVRRAHPGFVFLGEVYWGLEWALQQQGFDYTYDKTLYDRLRARDACAVRAHLRASTDFQQRSARFLENHDEPRAARVFPPGVHEAAAIITYLVPGLRFFHDGQLEGRRACVSPHLGRRPAEPVDADLQRFYARLLDWLWLPVARGGRFTLLDCRPAWEGNDTWASFVAFTRERTPSDRLLVTVNYGPRPAQCYVPVAWPDVRGRRVRLRDRWTGACYERDGDELALRGFYLDVPAWQAHVFDVRSLGEEA